ncbi:MAG: chromosomal replication initiator protein DnaA [bacterium]|nr:chromosomal replication initiator protein DnaA [bacterium]
MAVPTISAECLNMLWGEFVSEIGSPMNTFLAGCELGTVDEESNILTVVVANKFLKDFLEKPSRIEEIEKALRICFNNSSIRIKFVLAGEVSPKTVPAQRIGYGHQNAAAMEAGEDAPEAYETYQPLMPSNMAGPLTALPQMPALLPPKTGTLNRQSGQRSVSQDLRTSSGFSMPNFTKRQTVLSGVQQNANDHDSYNVPSELSRSQRSLVTHNFPTAFQDKSALKQGATVQTGATKEQNSIRKRFPSIFRTQDSENQTERPSVSERRTQIRQARGTQKTRVIQQASLPDQEEPDNKNPRIPRQTVLSDLRQDFLPLFNSDENETVSPAPKPHIVESVPEGVWQTNLQKNLLFDNFVRSSNNNLAAATAQAVAQSPGKIYNPLFFYSGVGLGKTHLINAIGNYIVKTRPELKVLYTSAEQFTNDFVEQLRTNSMQMFRNKFRNVDVLLIDDIHFIINKQGIQEEIFQTMDALKRTNRQIVLSSDCPPKQMSNVMSRLRSRFEWGMIADIQKPDLETRIAILSQKAENMSVNITPDILEYIASEFKSNVRELEGALTRVITYCSVMSRSLTMASTKEALASLLDRDENRKIDVDLVKRVVCEYFQISEKDLINSRREQKIVRPRQLAMYLCKEMIPGIRYAEIGEQFGKRDHTTVMHACQKVETNLDDEFYKTSLDNMRERLK